MVFVEDYCRIFSLVLTQCIHVHENENGNESVNVNEKGDGMGKVVQELYIPHFPCSNDIQFHR